jgi:hypothetical protein
MKRLAILAAIMLGAIAPAVAIAASPAARKPVQVMVVGLFHFSNPGQDMANIEVPDVSTPERQAEIVRIVEGLNRFHPTAVATEWPAATVAERYAKYADGTLAPSKNEVVQLGFRLGRLSGARVYGADQEGDFPFGPVDEWAKAHGHPNYTDEIMAPVIAETRAASTRLADGSLGAELYRMNDPAEILRSAGFYYDAMRMGAGDVQPGADLNGAWATRNYRICARIIQESKPGDRVVVFFGAGHAYLLRRCFTDAPGFELVEARRYLPER